MNQQTLMLIGLRADLYNMASPGNKEVAAMLERAVAEFGHNGLSRQAMSQCAQEATEHFLFQGLSLLKQSDGSSGYRFLAMLLLRSPNLVQELTDRWRFQRAEAVVIAIQLHRINRNFDTLLASFLPDRNNQQGAWVLEGDSLERALEILDEVSEGRKIVPMVQHLTRHKSPRVSAMSALLVGRRVQNVMWAARMVLEANDGRLRASAIEAMWGQEGPHFQTLFRNCLADADNRVVANALLGLHKAGDAGTNDLVTKLATQPDCKCRMSAAWVMGEIGNPTFVSVLAALVRDADPTVRRTSLRSLKKLHVARTGQVNPLNDSRSTPSEELTDNPSKIEGTKQSLLSVQRQFWS
jgi:hypothetical protein